MVKNPLRIDPTRTTMLRRGCIAEMNRRFRILRGLIWELIVKEDALGLLPGMDIFSMTANAPTQIWRFHTLDKKLIAFNRWLQKQINDKVLTVDAVGRPWDAKYIESAYRKGSVRAYLDAHPELGLENPDFYRGTKEQFLRSSFARPERTDKMRLLYTRSYEELKGVTSAMAQRLSRDLAQGMADGKSPLEIAKKLNSDISILTRTRARTIARTEIIHAHAEGQLDSFEELGVDELGVMAEWLVTKDDKLCDECSALSGVVLSVDEARGLLPRHPNCRCAWVPAMKDHRQPGQLWGRKAERAVSKSIETEGGEEESDWAGKEIFNYDPDQPRDILSASIRSCMRAQACEQDSHVVGESCFLYRQT